MLYNGPNHTPHTRNYINNPKLQLASCLRKACSWDRTNYRLSQSPLEILSTIYTRKFIGTSDTPMTGRT